MSASSTTRIELPAASAARQYRYMFWVGPGFVFSTMAYYLYPPMIGNSGYRPVWFMGLFVLAVALPPLWNLMRGRPADDTRFPASHAVSSLAYALIALAFLLNGALDRVPPREIRATVIRKAVVMAKNTHYHIIVFSWRPEETEEVFDVDSDVYRRAAVGKSVTVESHPGFFGVPWTGNISPE